MQLRRSTVTAGVKVQEREAGRALMSSHLFPRAGPTVTTSQTFRLKPVAFCLEQILLTFLHLGSFGVGLSQLLLFGKKFSPHKSGNWFHVHFLETGFLHCCSSLGMCFSYRLPHSLFFGQMCPQMPSEDVSAAPPRLFPVQAQDRSVCLNVFGWVGPCDQF